MVLLEYILVVSTTVHPYGQQPQVSCKREDLTALVIDWIIHVDGGARDPRVPTLFQVADCDTGHVRWISADEATRLVLSGLETSNVVDFTSKRRKRLS